MARTQLAIEHLGVLIRINKYYRPGMNALELYETTRGIWKINIKHAEKAQLAFAIFKGEIKEVYQIHKWQNADKDGYSTRADLATRKDISKRKEFIGQIASNEIRESYLGRQVSYLFEKGNQNPINYINC